MTILQNWIFYFIRSNKYLIRSYKIKVHVGKSFDRVRPDKISHDKDLWSASYQILHDKNSIMTGDNSVMITKMICIWNLFGGMLWLRRFVYLKIIWEPIKTMRKFSKACQPIELSISFDAKPEAMSQRVLVSVVLTKIDTITEKKILPEYQFKLM